MRSLAVSGFSAKVNPAYFNVFGELALNTYILDSLY